MKHLLAILSIPILFFIGVSIALAASTPPLHLSPLSLPAQCINQGDIHIEWDPGVLDNGDADPSVTRYRIYRAIGAGRMLNFDSVPASQTNYIAPRISKTKMVLGVKAVNAAGEESDMSNTLTIVPLEGWVVATTTSLTTTTVSSTSTTTMTSTTISG